MNRYLVKIAEALRQHQEDALAKLDRSGGIILHHSTGSGKTKSFLTAAQRALKENPDKRALIVAPASLTTNVEKELKKHDIDLDTDRLDVFSYEKATNMADELRKNKYVIAIADEAQKLRNIDTKRSQELSDIISRADKRVLSTATANYNHAADIAPLVNIAAGKKVLPEDRKQFENKYLKKVKRKQSFTQWVTRQDPGEYQDLKNTGELKDAFKKYVHYYDSREDPSVKDKFPTETEENIDVEMSHQQKQYYHYVEGQIPFWIRMKIRRNLPMDKKEKAQLNAFSTGVRQVSNSVRHLHDDPEVVGYTPKITRATDELEARMKADKKFRGLVYSNFLDAGVNEYARRLHEKGIEHAVYTGALNRQEKDEIVKGYNTGKIPVLIVSSSGAEGLDLKGTRLTQILEPHFNPSKTKQVKGRGARFESHEHLKPEERTMHTQYYRTVFSKPFLGKAPYSIDRYLSENSDDKEDVFAKMRELMKDTSKDVKNAK